MPVDAFIWFEPYKGAQPVGESQDDLFKTVKAFEIKEFNFECENKTSIGSATSGAGGGKVQLGQFTIKKNTDRASAIFFRNCAAGMHYKTVCIACRKAGATAGDSTASAGAPYLVFSFGTVFATKIAWSGPGDEVGPEESITFAYGALNLRYWQQKPDGSFVSPPKQSEWNQMTNMAEFENLPSVPGAK